MSPSTIRRLAALGILVLGMSGCRTMLPGDAPEQALLRVEISRMFVTVENRSGFSLREVRIEIVPMARTTDFSIIVPRMENGEKRDFPLGNFRGRDGTPFNLRVVRPKSLKVSGTDINNRTVQVEVPWK